MMLAILLLLVPVLAWSGLSQEPPTTRVRNCTNDDCHAEVMDFNYLHAPSAAGACDPCHLYDDTEEHTFKNIYSGARMCDFCHVGKSDTGGLYTHEPVEKGDCLECHNPHGADTRKMLRASGKGETCLSCHEDIKENKPILHTPFADGDCLSCHLAHSSIHPKLLIEEGRELCIRCHEDPALTGDISEILMPGSVLDLFTLLDEPILQRIHDPVVNECTQCHDHHGSNIPSLLIDKPLVLCKSCHEETIKSASSAMFPHTVVLSEDGCLQCHASHFSNVGHMLKAQSVDLCMDCHALSVTREDGTTIADVSEIIHSDVTLHGSANDGKCYECHDVHGGNNTDLLNQPYDPQFYQTFNIDAYVVCFECHDVRLILDEITLEATDFRNGLDNLHVAHVNIPNEPGRSCKVCHATHASTWPKLMHESVPYGEWRIPIKFQKTETGGSCAGGCHRAVAYDRDIPVKYHLKLKKLLKQDEL